MGRDANAGQDFVGRDKYGESAGNNSSRVEIYPDPHRSGYTNTEILENLQKAILGNPYNLGEPGMLKSMAELSAAMAGFHAWRTAADVERSNLGRDIKHHQERTERRLDMTDSRLSQFMVIMWVTMGVVGVEAVALIWLFVRYSTGN